MNAVELFPLTVDTVWQRYTRLPPDCTPVFYHYTPLVGLEGILRSGGLRASYRMTMNDPREFAYSKQIIFEGLRKAEGNSCLLTVGRRLASNIKLNLERLLAESMTNPRAYCACLSIESDLQSQWQQYADYGNGYAIGFDLIRNQSDWKGRAQRGEPHVAFAPVIYDEPLQRDLIPSLIMGSIQDLKIFSKTVSNRSSDLTSLRDRIALIIATQTLTLIDYFKHPSYASEREIRLILHGNALTLSPKDINYFSRGSERIPYVFIDMRTQVSGLLPISEIKIGPNANLTASRRLVGNLILGLGYGSRNRDWPQITVSSL